MAKRRSRRGGGTIRKNEYGKWVATHSQSTDGQRVRISKVFETRAEGLQWLAKRTIEKKNDHPVIHFQEFLRRWLMIVEEQVKLNTVKFYTNMSKHLKAFPDKLLHEISRKEIDDFLLQLKSNGKSPDLRRKIIKTLRSIFSQAVSQGFMIKNIASLVPSPRVEKKEVQPFSREEILQFFFMNKGKFFLPHFLVLLDSGCRPGELSGLKWEDLDLEKGVIRIRRTAVYVNQKLTYNKPKSKAGLRDLSITQKTTEVIKALPKKGEYVFTMQRGSPLAPVALSDAFRGYCAKAKITPRNLYVLRHTCATLLIASGISIKAVSERLGHSNIAITLQHYAHAIPSDSGKIVEELTKILG